MDKEELTSLLVYIFLMFGICIYGIALGYGYAKKVYYKQGQIDYANGIIKYELKEQADKTVVWTERSK